MGDRIRTAREERGWTQPELGRIVGVSKSTVYQWESGAVQNLKLGNLFAFAFALSKDVRDLVFGSQKIEGIAERLPKYSVAPGELALLQMYDDLPRNVQRHVRRWPMASSQLQTSAAAARRHPQVDGVSPRGRGCCDPSEYMRKIQSRLVEQVHRHRHHAHGDGICGS